VTTIITASVLSVVVVVVSLLLIAGCFENAARIQQAIAGNSNALQPTTTTTTTTTNTNNNNNNGGALSLGPPEKMTLEGQSKPPILSPDKKQALEQDQAKTHLSRELPISDQTIQGPTPGTQAK
jgi:outer membrane lipoprotein-sorting protein